MGLNYAKENRNNMSTLNKIEIVQCIHTDRKDHQHLVLHPLEQPPSTQEHAHVILTAVTRHRVKSHSFAIFLYIFIVYDIPRFRLKFCVSYKVTPGRFCSEFAPAFALLARVGHVYSDLSCYDMLFHIQSNALSLHVL